MIPEVPEWLQQSVPLWAFLLAGFTRPATWSRAVTSAVKRRLESVGEGSG